MADSRICGKTRKTVGASTLQSQAQAGKRDACSPTFIGFHQTEERVPNRFRQHRRFGAALLLLHDHQRLIETRISLVQLRAQNADLRVLATQAEHRCSRRIRVMDVTRNEAAEIVGILSRASAASFVQQKADAIHTLENSRALQTWRVARQSPRLNVFRSAVLVEASQLRHLSPVNLRHRKAQLFLKGLLHYGDVAVFTEHQRYDDPVISRADLPVSSPIPEKASLPPFGNVRRGPVEFACFLVECRSLMMDIPGCKKAAAPDRFDRFPHNDAVDLRQ